MRPWNSGEPHVTGDDIFEVARIAPTSADAVYGLVAMLHPEVTADDWAAFVRDHSQDGARPRGVFALRGRAPSCEWSRTKAAQSSAVTSGCSMATRP